MVLHPVGPLAPSTYWRRRAVLLVAVLTPLLLLKSCAGGGDDVPAAAPGKTAESTKPSAAPRVVASTKPSPSRASGGGTCADGDLKLVTDTDQRTYPVGASPRFTLTVTNTSGTACKRDLGGGALELLVYSGRDRIWSSDDCGADAGTSVQTLTPATAKSTSVTWSGKRSAAGCPSGRPEAKPGTYVLRARLGTLQATTSVFSLAG
jgi:hypothetical protein